MPADASQRETGRRLDHSAHSPATAPAPGETVGPSGRGLDPTVDETIQDDADTGGFTVLTFVLSGQQYAVTVDCVREIIEARIPLPFPASPRWLRGIVDLRGASVPVVDLADRLGLTGHPSNPQAHAAPLPENPTRPSPNASEPSASWMDDNGAAPSANDILGHDSGDASLSHVGSQQERRIIVLEIDGADGQGQAVGILCDRVQDVRALPLEALEAVPAFVDKQLSGRAAHPTGHSSGDGAIADGEGGAEAASARPSADVLKGILRHASGLAMLLDHKAALGAVLQPGRDAHG